MSKLKVKEPVYPVKNYEELSETEKFNLAFNSANKEQIIKSKKNGKTSSKR